jgi:hypothetical protein
MRSVYRVPRFMVIAIEIMDCPNLWARFVIDVMSASDCKRRSLGDVVT